MSAGQHVRYLLWLVSRRGSTLQKTRSNAATTLNGAARTSLASSLTRLLISLLRHVTASSATASPPAPSAAAPEQQQAAPVLPFRVGYGFDLHRLVEGKKLIICGIDVPHVRGCDAHSDGEFDLHCTKTTCM